MYYGQPTVTPEPGQSENTRELHTTVCVAVGRAQTSTLWSSCLNCSLFTLTKQQKLKQSYTMLYAYAAWPYLPYYHVNTTRAEISVRCGGRAVVAVVLLWPKSVMLNTHSTNHLTNINK